VPSPAPILAELVGKDFAGNPRKPLSQTNMTANLQDEPLVGAGIDGEALKLNPPLRFRTRPQALRVRIAPQHPGASPSATMPESPWGAIRAVAHIATHGSS
jgi:hypothetical protein